MKKIFLFIISSAVGIPLVIWVYQRIGLADAFSQLKILTWWQIGILFLLGFINVFIWIFRWRLILRALGYKNLSFGRLAGARLGEMAISYITPGIHYGGEIVRIIALKKSKKVPLSATVTSIILDRIMEGVGLCVFLFFSAAVFIFKRSFVWASFLMVLGIFILFLFILIFKLFGLGKVFGFFAKLFRLDRIKRFDKSGRITNLAEKIKFIGRECTDFFRKAPAIVYSGIILSCLFLFIGATQIALFIRFLGKSLSLSNVLPMKILVSLSGLIPIPADLGVYEGASVLAFKSFGFGVETGLGFSIMTRFIDFSLVAIGISIIVIYFTEVLFKFSGEFWSSNHGTDGYRQENNNQNNHQLKGITSKQIKKIFLDFFKNKGHQVVASSSLVPADPTALFTSAGMQQFSPYLSGRVISPYQRACSVQKCFRTSDIDEVGDGSHHTFFEMLGNWSFGDYFKEEAIKWALELLVEYYKLQKDKLWVTVFKGDGPIPRDKEAIRCWQKAGIPVERIKDFGVADNFWGPVGESGPCGPCSEIHVDLGEKFSQGKCNIKGCGPNCVCGRFIEIWNLVFMEYNKTRDGKYERLPARNIDTGAGLERLTWVLQNKKSDYQTDLFWPIIQQIAKISGHDYSDNLKSFRIIADHLRGACFLIADGVLPSKEDRGYVLRRIIRRAMRYSRLIGSDSEKKQNSQGMENKILIPTARTIINFYKNDYPELGQKENDILTVIQNEEEKFAKTLSQGLKKFKKIIKALIDDKKSVIEPLDVFHLYDTYGFPLELTKELAEEKNLTVDEQEFKKEFEHHKEISRAGAKKKFGGVGEWGEKVAPHHTATHLLHQALREVLGSHVQQAGSDLTPERLRFDFTHGAKLTDQEIARVEEIVNKKIKQGLEVNLEEMPYEGAIKQGAMAFFKEKYPKIVKVYSIGDFSKEICAGPHVKNTKEIGHFKIIKEKASGAGVRRIKATIKK